MNKKSKKNIIISSLILILLVGFNGIMIVNGDNNASKPSPSGNITGGTCTGNNIGVPMKSATWAYGVRIALVDKNGNKKGIVRDIWDRGQIDGDLYNAPVFTYGGSFNALLKQQVGDNKKSIEFASANLWDFITKDNDSLVMWTSTVDTYYQNFGSLGTKYPGKKWTSLFSLINETDANFLKLATEKPNDFKSLLTGFFKTSDINLSEDFIQVEPLLMKVIWRCKSKKYGIQYGTLSELFHTNTVCVSSDDCTSVNWGGGKHFWGAYILAEKTYGLKTVGINIKSDAKENEMPKGFKGVGNVTPSYNTFMASWQNGYAVAHLWLGKYTSSSDCYQALKYINKTYSPESGEYKTAIEQVVAGTFEWKDENGNQVKIDKAYSDPKENYWLLNQNYLKREKMGKKASCFAAYLPCDQVVDGHINKSWSGLTKGTDDYHTAIEQVVAGTYMYYAEGWPTKDEDGNIVKAYDYWLIDGPQSTTEYPGLLKANYGNEFAWCGEAEKKKCDEVVSYINSHPAEYPKTFSAGGTALMSYDEAIAKVRAGTFSYEVKEIVNGIETKKTISVDQAYNNPTEYYYLIKANYDRDRGGVAACDSKPQQPDVCGSQADVKIDECETGQTHFKDNEGENNWLKCETAYVKDGTYYTSDNTGHEATTGDYEGIVGNLKYCQVFCYEEVETNFPTEQYVKAGRTFFWGLDKSTGTFGTIKVKKKCSNQKRTDPEGASGEGYLYKKWDTDYKNNERALITNYLAKGDYEEAKKNEHISASCSSYCARYCGSGKNRHCCLTKYNGSARSGWTNNHNATSDSEWMGSFSVGRTVSGSSSGKSSCSAARTAAIRDLKSNADSLASAANNAYTGYKNNETPLLNKIRQCTNNIKYVYKTTVYFVFDEPENTRYGTNSRDFHYNDKLIQDPEGEDEGYNKENVVGGRYLPKTCTAKIVYSYICTGSAKSSKCSPKNERVLDCKQVTWEIEGEWDYKYDEEYFTWFSLKYNSSDKTQTLMNKKNKPDEDENLFYSIGFGLPTAFSLTSGKYLMHVDVGNLGDHGRITDSDPSYVGEKNYNAANGHFWPVAEEDEHGHGLGFKYECEYTVDNQIFQYDCQYENGQLTAESAHYCDPTEDENSNGNVIGIDVAYRLVSLLQAGDEIEKAFPGIGGEGRPIGENWDIVSSELEEILRSDIYESEAMYEILLDVGTIQYIRKDNEKYFSSGKDPYTSFDNVICKSTGSNGEHKYCASDFISDLASSDYGQQGGTVLMGTCIPVTDTEARAEEILNNGCNGTYTYPDFSWVR